VPLILPSEMQIGMPFRIGRGLYNNSFGVLGNVSTMRTSRFPPEREP